MFIVIARIYFIFLCKIYTMLKQFRKLLKLNTKELDRFIDSNSPSTKYYLENSYRENKLFKYLLFLRFKGVDLNEFFDSENEQNPQKLK